MIRKYMPNKPKECFETLYQRYVNKVYRRCLSMTRDAIKAEDFTHDIFLKAFSKLDAFQERSTFSTWLYAIAFNYCSDQIRIARRQATLTLEDGLKHDIADPTDNLHEETLYLVQRVMKTLTDDEQAILRLKYEEGLRIDQIAELYNINPSAVKMRLKRSRDKIHVLYEQRLAS